MKNFIWKALCAYYYLTITKVKFHVAWYLASVAQEQDDWQDYSPRETVIEEISYWD